MKQPAIPVAFLLLLLLSLGVGSMLGQGPGPASPLAALGTAFTYQGQLKQNGSLVNGNSDLRFSLWHDANAGGQLGLTQTVANQPISAGLFTVQLNGNNEFGGSPFNGQARWLKIEVRCPAGSGSYVSLSPRQPLTAAPYALGLRLSLDTTVFTPGAALSLHNAEMERNW